MQVSETEEKLLFLLNDPSWYSLEFSSTSRRVGMTEAQLRQQAKTLTEKGHQINIFEFNGVTYIGTEQRRLDYERDKANGTNHIEKMITAGYYRKANKK